MSAITFQGRPLLLELDQPFRIAHGSSRSRTNMLVEWGDIMGEAALPPYYPSRPEDIVLYLENLDLEIPEDGPFPLEEVLNKLTPGPAPAQAAVDMALHDLWARRLGHPLYRLFGLDARRMPTSFYALSIPDSFEALDAQLRDKAGWPCLKLKLGSGDPTYDEAIVRRTRAQYGGNLCVDVNGGWSMETALKLIPALSNCSLEFIEEPIPLTDPDDWHLLRRLLPATSPPLMADESVRTLEDVLALSGAADGVNLKLAKCGGIGPVRRKVALARALDLRVMIGCMIESSLAITAAAHIGPLADYLDLDGQMHLSSDPFRGVLLEKGRLTLPEVAGLGVRPV